MTHSPEPDPAMTPDPTPKRKWIKRIGVPVGGTLLLGLAGGTWWAYRFVQNDLAPLIETNLSKSFNRPIKIGKLTHFGWNHLRFGPSEIPATPTDPDFVTIAGIDASFNPLQAVWTRQVKLNVALDRPMVHLEQDKVGRWVTTEIKEEKEKGPVEIELTKLELKNAAVTLVPWAGDRLAAPVALPEVKGQVEFSNKAKHLNYQLQGKSKTDGTFEIQGETIAPELKTKLQVRGQNFLAAEIDRLVNLPVEIRAGRAGGNLTIEMASLKDAPKINGTARVEGVTLQVPGMPVAFTQSTGGLQFKNSQLRLDEMRSRYGSVPLIAQGTLDPKTGFDITAKIEPIDLAKVTDTLKVETPFPIVATIAADMKLSGPTTAPVLSGLARSTKPSQIDKLAVKQFNTQFQLNTNDSEIVVSKFQAEPAVGGKLTSTGKIKLGDRPTIDFDYELANVPVTPIAKTYAPEAQLPFDLGVVNGKGRLFGPADALRVQLAGLNVSPAIGGTVALNGDIQLGKDRPLLDIGVQLANIPASTIARTYAPDVKIPFDLGTVNAQTRLVGPLDQPNIEVAQLTVNPAIGGSVVVDGSVQLTSDRPKVALNVKAENLPGDAIAKAYGDGSELPIAINQVSAQGTISGTIDALETQILWSAPDATYAAKGEVVVAGGKTVLRDTTLDVAGGTVLANAEAENGRWQGTVALNGIGLTSFSPDLRGELTGDFQVAGSMDSFKPSDIRAEGQANLSKGISLIQTAIAADVQWDGRNIIIEKATSPGFEASGTVTAQLEGTPEITDLNLRVRSQGLSIAALNLPTPSAVSIQGTVDYEGVVKGRPTAPQIAGQVNLQDLTVNGIAFEPTMKGTVAVGQGVDLKLAGNRDRIALALNSANEITNFELQRESAIARGRMQGDLLVAETRDFPLEFVTPTNLALVLPISGNLTGNVAIDLKRQAVSGDVAIVRPAIAGYRADGFQGRIQFANGVAMLNNAKLQRGSTIFEMNGSVDVFSPDPTVKGSVAIASGQLRDVLELAQIFELADLARGAALPNYGSSADLDTIPAQMGDKTVFDQLRRLSEVQTLVAQAKEKREQALLPELRDLSGEFTAKIDVNGSLKSGVAMNFDVKGQDWQWGTTNSEKTFLAKEVAIIGSLKDGVVNLQPMVFKSADSRLLVRGNFGGQSQNGQLEVVNVPIEAVKPFLPPDLAAMLKLEGNMNGTATVTGSIENPIATGEISLNDGLINNKPVKFAKSSFDYTDARFGFDSEFNLDTPENITISGSVPQKLPFAKVEPKSNEIDLKVNVKNDGLALLNLFTNQVTWLEGQGEANVTVGGTLLNPQAQGKIRVDKAILKAQAIPEQPLTDVTGEIVFAGDRLRLDQPLTGKFSKGDFSAIGVIPLFQRLAPNDPDQANPLMVEMDRIALRLKGVYQGGVKGKVAVNGSLLNPIIGGEIVLADGQVLLSDAAETAPEDATSQQSPVEFDNLSLKLGKDVRVTRQPIINFLASGDLVINGNLSNLQPEGIINLNAGQVNLFTTQFNLQRGYPQRAIFTPDQGLDPTLDVRLIASVPEVTGSRLPTNVESSEVLDSNTPGTRFGGLQTVRVQVRAQGRASELFDRGAGESELFRNLELTSSPSRTPSEIVSLIGGGFVATLGRGDSTLGIANLAGSALLTNVQSLIGNALGLSEFRLFPTLVRENRDRESSRSSTLGLAGEAAVDITSKFSVSVLKILTTSDPAQFGIRYRVNDNLLMRASTDFSGDSRAVVEYEARF